MKNFVTIIIVVIVAVSVVFALIFFGSGSVKSGLSVEPHTNNGNTDSLSRELLQALSSLKDLKLDDKLFKDKVFLSLIPFSKDIEDEQLGRENPFLPVEAADGVLSR